MRVRVRVRVRVSAVTFEVDLDHVAHAEGMEAVGQLDAHCV